MKKLFAIMLAGLMLLGFSACTQQQSVEEKSNDEEIVTDDEKQELTDIELGRTFNDKKNGIKISLPTSWGDYSTSTNQNFSATVLGHEIFGKNLIFISQDRDKRFDLYLIDKTQSESYKKDLNCFNEDEAYDYCYTIKGEGYEDEAQAIASEIELYEPSGKESFSLYYYNLEKDKEIDESIPCSADAVLPVNREVPESMNKPAEALKMLLKGEITEEEESKGFQTEFEPGKLELLSISISDGTATIEFEDDGGFTSGGSCRTGLLAAQIKKTLLQFDTIDKVVFLNEAMFQP